MALVKMELIAAERMTDSVLQPLPVNNLIDEGGDYWIAPVWSGKQLVAIYRDDPRRDSIKSIAVGLALKTIRPELLTVTGIKRFLVENGLNSDKPVLVSVGPLYFFGSPKVGWYAPTEKAYVLISLTGSILDSEKVKRLWPDKAELIESWNP
jgi:hypothetical protein